MDQVSRPLLIALAATVALLVVWLVALRPKPVGVGDTPLAPTQAVAPAEQAAAAADAAGARVQAATGARTPAPAASAATTAPAVTAAKPSATTTTTAAAAKAADRGRRDAGPTATSRGDAAVLRDVRRGKVVVVLFWSPGGADDIATRGAIRNLDRHRGRVAVHIVPIARVGRYPSITQKVTISQSPTTLVIDRRQRTRVIAGLSEPRELAQAVGDALAGR